MDPTTSHPSVREVEAAFLRKGWWLFPVLGALASLAVGGPFWAWVEGQPISIQWTNLFSLRTVLAALAFLAVPAAWRFGLRFKGSRLVVGAAVLGVVCGAECLLRSPVVQIPLWLAARDRLDADQHFMREVCYVRLEEAAGRAEAAPAVVLVGSSQVLNGVDEHRLREWINPMPVIRRAMFGMTPLKALSMLAYVPFRRDDVCLQYLSEFDFTNQDEFPFAWFRPYASWRTLPAVLRCVRPAVWARRWRQTADYAMAATFENWRDRDFLRRIALNCRGTGSRSEAAGDPPDPAALAKQAQAELRFSAAEAEAFQAYMRELARRGTKLMVFEGDVNPVLHSPARLKAKAETRRQLAAWLATDGCRYVSLADQGLALGPEHWHDMTHLNAEGRDRLTKRMAEELRGP